MISMSRARQERAKPVLRLALEFSVKRRGPIVIRLLGDGCDHNLDHLVELAQHFVFGNSRITELQRPLPNISSPANLRSDVGVQVPGEMKDEVANTVAVSIRPRPKLLG